MSIDNEKEQRTYQNSVARTVKTCASVFAEVRPPTLTIYELNDNLLVSSVTDVALFFVWISQVDQTWLFFDYNLAELAATVPS